MPSLVSQPPVINQPGMPRVGGSKATMVTLATFWAIGLFALLNVFLWQAFPLDRVSGKDLWNGTGSIDLALQDLAALKQRPNVVLLGSSLVMFPFWAMDKERDQSIGDIFHHHLSHTMEDQLVAAGFQKPTVASLAIFGQMASDAYIYVDQYLQGAKKPEYLVLGIAPRDFSDSDLPAPMATLTFKRLVGLSNLARYASLYLPSWNDKADFVAAHACFFYGNRWHLQRETLKAINKAYAFFGVKDPSVAAAATQAGFMLSGSNEERWKNSLDEYRRRYHGIENRDLSIQMTFLDRLLGVCQQRHIKAIIVNMPLTDVNRALFPPGFYESFSNRVAAICNRPGVQLLDLGSSADFVHDDYWDTTHLSHYGGHKLLKHLVPLLGREPAAAAAQ